MLSMDPVFASHVRLPVSPLLRQQPGVAAPLSRPNLACHAAPNRISIPPRSVALRLTTRYGGRCLPSYLVSEDSRRHLLSKVLARVLRTPYRCYYGFPVVLCRLNSAPLARPYLAWNAAPGCKSIYTRPVALRLTTRYGGRCLPSYLVSEDSRRHLLSKVLARVLRTLYRCYHGFPVVLCRLNVDSTLFNATRSLARLHLPASPVSLRPSLSPRRPVLPNRCLGT